MILSAVLIVRDAIDDIEACIRSVEPFVDEIVVHDTGSTDGTDRAAAALLGAHPRGTLVRAGWDDDFASARNKVLADAHGRWVLSIDADERLVAGSGRTGIREALAHAEHHGQEALWIAVHNSSDAGEGYTHRVLRLFRHTGIRWSGAVHERLLTADGGSPDSAPLPPSLLRLEHDGYMTDSVRRRKAERNVAIAVRALDAMPAESPERPHLLLAMGRSLAAVSRRDEAVEVLRALRRDHPAAPERLWAADVLARTLLCGQDLDPVLPLVEELRLNGVGTPYCDWLEAQTLARTGHGRCALRLLEGLGHSPVLVDSMDRVLTEEPVKAMRTLTLLSLGRRADAELLTRNTEGPQASLQAPIAAACLLEPARS